MARNMEWMEKVKNAKYDAETTDISLLTPTEGNFFFFEEEQARIETGLADSLADAMKTATNLRRDRTQRERICND